jgi:cytochrome c biogenesis protein ResB
MSSLRLGIVLIALIAAACIAGSIVGSDANMGIDFAQAYVFHTPWFIGLMGLLLVNLILCSWEKSYIALTLYWKRNFIANKSFYHGAQTAAILHWSRGVEALEPIIANRYTVCRRQGKALYAQKGFVGRCGATVIHIGLLWTMAAGFYRILADDLGFGIFDSTVILAEGETGNSFFQRIDRLKKNTADNMVARDLPFNLRLLDFRADYYPHSTVARHYSSLIELQDGEHTEISEVSMTNPLVYRGHKVTQNSFQESDRVPRGEYRITDLRTGTAADVDASPGDPVRVRLDGSPQLFLQVDQLGAGAGFKLMDLAERRVLTSGTVSAAVAHGEHEGMDMAALEEQLKASKYSILVAALFPNFRLDQNGNPTTLDDQFDNPAALVMVFKNGRANGASWAFLRPEAQGIVGQAHPEIELTFAEYRRAQGGDSMGGLFGYEVRMAVRQKSPPLELGSFWMRPGALTELSVVDPAIVAAPNVTTTATASQHGTPSNSPSTTSPDASTTATSTTEGGAGPQVPAAGGTAAGPPANGYAVEYVGMRNGHISFLGFMKDPSVNWIFAGCIIVIVGTLIAFMVVYREAWALVDEAEQRVYLAARVRGTSPHAHREFARLVGEIQSAEAQGHAVGATVHADPK